MPALVLAAAAAHGQADAQPTDAQASEEQKADAEALKTIRTEKWIVGFEPSAWYGGPGGDIKLPGGGESVSLSDINLDSPRLSPAAELHLWSGDWRFALGGSYIEEHDRGSTASDSGQLGSVAFAAGDQLDSSLTFWEVEATVGKLIRLPATLTGNGRNFNSNLELFGGMRLYGTDFDFAAPSGSVSTSQTFGHPLVGIKYTMNLVEQFTIDVQFDIGYFTDGGDKSALAALSEKELSAVKDLGAYVGNEGLSYLVMMGARPQAVG